MILRLIARLDVVQSGHANDSLPKRVGKEGWLKKSFKRAILRAEEFCNYLKSFAFR